MTIKEEALEARMQRRQELIAASGMLGALAASSCCILPLRLRLPSMSRRHFR